MNIFTDLFTINDVLSSLLITLVVSGISVLISILIGIPIGILLAIKQFTGRDKIILLSNTLTGLPPTVVGLVVYLILTKTGPLGFFDLLFTPQAMIIAQVILILPIVISLTESTIRVSYNRIGDTIISLGANKKQIMKTIINEARKGINVAILTAFGRAISEVGAVLMVGGGIRYFTRNLTVGILFSVELGEFNLAIILAIILLLFAFCVNILVTNIQGKRKR